MQSRGPERLYLIREKGYANQAFDDIMAYEIPNAIKPGMIWDDIEEYIDSNELKDKWALSENEDEADDIMDDDDAAVEKDKHIRLTIKPDTIDAGEERDEVKGFDAETTIEIKFFKKDEATSHVQIVVTKGDHAHWKQIFTKEDGLKSEWIKNGTMIQYQNPELVAA